MSLYSSQAGAVNISPSGVLTLDIRQFLTPCTTLLYNNLSLDEELRTSVTNYLIAEGIFSMFDRMPCLKEPHTLISRLNAKTDDQLEKFFVNFLQGNHGVDSAMVESRRQIREDFTRILLQQIHKTPNRNGSNKIHSVSAYYYEFGECVRALLVQSRHQLPSHIDYSKLSSSKPLFTESLVLEFPGMQNDDDMD